MWNCNKGIKMKIEEILLPILPIRQALTGSPQAISTLTKSRNLMKVSTIFKFSQINLIALHSIIEEKLMHEITQDLSSHPQRRAMSNISSNLNSDEKI